MTREIKFRGKRVTDNTWVYGYYCCIGREGNQKHYIIPEYEVGFWGIEVNPETVGQYIGLVDMDKKEIYEDDLIPFSGYRLGDCLLKVEFSKDRGGFYPFAKGDGCGCCEDEVAYSKFLKVAGNIHDNPELLKEVKS